MKIDALIKKLTQKRTHSRSIFAVVQPDSIYFSSSAELSLPEHYPLSNHSWPQALIQALKQSGAKGVTVDVVLHSQLYQSYQIEKPALPREEWPAALPFLLKDLISEKVTEVVADAHPLTGSSKVQAYVMARKQVLEVAALLESLGCELGRLLPEQEVWAHCLPEQSHFLLLQRSKGGHFKLDAFVDKQCHFQRTLRGVVAPITGVASSALQLDGLALELQRSIDYLSSQLKGVALHQLKVCCDDEDHVELVQALNERLSVKVSPLSNDGAQALSGQVLAQHTSMAPGDTLNFYQDHLRPKKDYFSLSAVIGVWGVALALMLVVSGIYRFNIVKQGEALAGVEQQAAQLSQQVSDLKKQVDRHQPSASKVAAVARLKKEIAAKQASLNAISDFDHSLQVGYSGVMDALAKLARRDISLNQIEMDKQRFDIQGLAREAKVIPNWIAEFQSELHLVGRSFDQLVIGRNDEDVVTFELKTKQGAKR
ncbi:MSHA biogenesis protein MshI [Vibrio fluvialis]|nr:MSHA biogenesis protein MshI [Vibrio fluvialis]EKO3448903.1 MSHA biogenesis protein MshI [Vibrio fluvialis]ELG2964311.1 MSHA biogenesis protein MshI [Vibrio fluvialis]ELZ1260568.1 MSHA biogenesis protein MshI [Vibrio fluvialis]